MDTQTAKELRALADQFLSTPWWDFGSKLAIAQLIAVKIKFRVWP